MKELEVRRMGKLELTYWWFVARRRLVRTLLKAGNHTGKLLDVGCGTGAFLNETRNILDGYGIDVSLSAIKFLSNKRGLGKKVVRSDVKKIGFQSDVFSNVVALDIFEHLSDEREAIKECWRVLKKRGRLIITVPAHQALWSEHDEALGHCRRYIKRDLVKKIEKAGFKIKKISYCIFLLFFPILLYRLLQRLFSQSTQPHTSLVILPSWINWALIKLLDVETIFLRRGVVFPIGVSLLCIAEK